MSQLNGGNVIVATINPTNGWYLLLDESNKPFLKVRSKAWAFFLEELINNRGSDPDEETTA